jgi:hypothetical protein
MTNSDRAGSVWLLQDLTTVVRLPDPDLSQQVASLYGRASDFQEDLRVQASPPQSISLARTTWWRLLESRIVPMFPGLLLAKR